MELQNLSEAEELFESAKDTIASLFRISILIRNASPRDRFTKALAAKQAPIDDSFDINHVRHKFPRLDCPEKIWLQERLGKAITHRRQYLRYARDHRHRLAEETPELWKPAIQAIPVEPGKLDISSTKSQSGHTNLSKPTSSFAPTSASTFLDCGKQFSLSELDIDDNQSQTSYAVSLSEGEEETLQLPKLDDVAKKGFPFECPLCWTIQNTKKESSWRKHAFSDLRPYVCTFENCDVKLFSDRRDWFEHELEQHRSIWTCNFCDSKNFRSLANFEHHVRVRHQQSMTDAQFEALSEAYRRPVDQIPASECPFCTEWETKLRQTNPTIKEDAVVVVTPQQFMKHVGSHMQQLALFAIPRGYTEGDDDAESGASVAVARDVKNGSSDLGDRTELVEKTTTPPIVKENAESDIEPRYADFPALDEAEKVMFALWLGGELGEFSSEDR